MNNAERSRASMDQLHESAAAVVEDLLRAHSAGARSAEIFASILASRGWMFWPDHPETPYGRKIRELCPIAVVPVDRKPGTGTKATEERTARGILAECARAEEVDPRKMMDRSLRSEEVVRARHRAVWMVGRTLGWGDSRVSRFFGIDHTTVIYIRRNSKFIKNLNQALAKRGAEGVKA